MTDPVHQSPQFQGFDHPRQNYFKMPNNWTDITSDMGSIAELKVVEYVLKNTWGYQEYGIAKRISLTEFMYGRRRTDGSRMDKGTGLSKPSVISGLKAAVERGLLIEETDDSDRARIKKYYRLRMIEDPRQAEAGEGSEREGTVLLEEVPEETAQVKDLNAEVKTFNRGVKNFDLRGKSSLPRTEKETTERNLQERQQHNNSVANDLSNDSVVVASLLVDKGMGKGAAQQLAATHSETYIREKIAFLEFLLDERPNDVQKPAAWLRRAIEHDFAAPDGFVSEEERQQQAEAEEQHLQAAEQARTQQLARARALEQERTQRLEAARASLRKEYGTPDQLEVEWNTVVEEIRLTGQDSLYGLLANSQALSVTDNALDVAVTSSFHAQQLSHPNTIKLLKRIINRMTSQEYVPHFVVVESIA